MLYALIGPEFVLIWAWRQRKAASQTSEILTDWSRVHGFFATMGGFVDGERALSLEDIEELVRNEEIEYPIVSREEIQDRSKGDAVTKALVVLQTAWFLLQCVARASQHLALTELELATAAFAVLSIIMYVLWWDKPLDVQCPISVRRRRSREELLDRNREDDNAAGRARDSRWDSRGCIFHAVRGALIPFICMLGALDEEVGEGGGFLVVGESLYNKARSRPFLLVWGTIVTMIFGGIHCIGMSFDFPSHAEQNLWRISSIAITGIPYLWGSGLIFIRGLVDPRFRASIVTGPQINENSVIFRCLLFVHTLCTFLYIASRFLLLVLSFTTLRSLPSSAFQTVEWTMFLPHL